MPMLVPTRATLAAMLLAVFTVIVMPGAVLADDQKATHFFETKVRPLLAQHCYACHGPDEQKSDLRLDQRNHFLNGGAGGPIVEPGKPEESVLIEAVKWESYEMPPDKPLADDEIAILEQWVAAGAYWPEHGETREDTGLFSDEDRAWWAFQPVTQPEVPAVDEGAIAHNPIDHFILAKLKEEKIAPAPPAEKRDLIRRLYFDMLGVPPTVEEVEAFVADESPDAYEALVDQVLADSRYGQRWATHWLDLVRYADSDGYRQDAYRPRAWRYRDYVIRSLNEDKSYKQFVQEQLAGDEMAPDNPDALVATYFLRAGVYEYNALDATGQQTLLIDELTDTVGDVFLGMGIACAHCHNHKFDPILRDDYYRLQAFFQPMVWKDEHMLATPEEVSRYEQDLAAWEAKHEDLLAKIEAIEAPARMKQRDKAISMFPESVQKIYAIPEEKRTTYDQQIAYLVEKWIKLHQSRLPAGIPSEQRKEWEALKKELQAFLKSQPTAPPTADIAVDAAGPIAPVRIPGDRREREIPPGFLTILAPEPAQIDPSLVQKEGTSGRRATLAEWLTQDDNPLAPRVIVNRIWQYHFGTGLSGNASDFGRLGEPPSHPELLDWLTRQFIDQGWHLKPLHRQILLSATYRQSSLVDPPEQARLVDPKNRLLWRFPARRLEAEPLRDAMLAVSGELRPHEGGPASSVNEPVRAVYTKKMRNSPDPLLESFDSPAGFASVAERNTTTTATQSLLMINGDWTLKRAEAMAKRLQQEFGNDSEGLIRRSYQECYGREPSTAELSRAVAFLEGQEEAIRQRAAKMRKELPSTALLDEPQMQRWNTAFNISDETANQYLSMSESAALPSHNFTIEAIVFPRTLFKNASVRTIAAHWSGATSSRGWGFGITSEQSSYRPRNLIVQLVGDDKDGNRKYEVVASNLRIPSDKPYYVGAAVDFDAGTVTFYARDMSYDESELETVVVPHSIVGNCHDAARRFTVGGRDTDGFAHHWDGLIDDVRLTGAAIAEERKILINSPNELVTDDTLGMWRFVRSDQRGPLAALNADEYDLQLSRDATTGGLSPRLVALQDYCHVLLNSSEFQFVD